MTTRRRPGAPTGPDGISRLCLAIMVMVVSLTGCGGSSETAPGQIVFAGLSPARDHFNLIVMNPDGTGVRWLTRSNVDFVAFARQGEGDVYEIWVMNAGGSEQRRLTRGGDSAPVWSPDGEKIAFERGSAGGSADTIVVVNDDGRQERMLFAAGEPGGHGPAWSPDGSQIAFFRSEEDLGETEIWMMDADGDNARKVPAGPFGQPSGLDWAAEP